jgi:hypothetical protein
VSLLGDRSMRNPFPWTGGPPCGWPTSLGRAGQSDPGMMCLELAAFPLPSPTGAERLVTSAWQDYTSERPRASTEARGLSSPAVPAHPWCEIQGSFCPEPFQVLPLGWPHSVRAEPNKIHFTFQDLTSCNNREYRVWSFDILDPRPISIAKWIVVNKGTSTLCSLCPTLF